MGTARREKTRNAPSASLSLALLYIPYKDRCDWLPTPCLINTVLPSSPSFSHTLSVFHRPGSLAFKAFIGDCGDRNAGKTEWNSIKWVGAEAAHDNKMLLNWKEMGKCFNSRWTGFVGILWRLSVVIISQK